MRSNPNILIVGTPGTGKTSLVNLLMTKDQFKNNFKSINISEFAKEHECIEEFDQLYKCDILDEEKLIEKLEAVISNKSGGFLVDYHSGDLVPSELVDVVVVLRCNNTVLYDRLTERGYNGKKLQDNMDAEIFQTILDEARECHENVLELQSDKEEDMEINCSKICDFVSKWNKK